MRVLIYAHFFAPSIGGVETYARLLAEGLPGRARSTGAKDVEITVVTNTPADAAFDSSLPFRVVRQPGWIKLLGLIRASTVVQLTGPSLLPMFLAMLVRKPFVVEQHGYQAVCPNGLLLYTPSKEVCPGHFAARNYFECIRCNRSSGLRKSLSMLFTTFPRHWLCQRSDANIAITSHVDRRLGLANTHTIYYGVPDPLPCGLSDAPIAAFDTSDTLCFAFVGRLVGEKGLPLLIQAASRLRAQGYKFQVKFVGDGPERKSLEAAVSSLGLSPFVTFTGFVSGKELDRSLSDVAAVVMPSIWEETAGLGAIEQMFRGRLVIVAEIGGLAEVVGAAGLKFPAGDAVALANCMRQVLDEPDIVFEHGQRARNRALDCFGLKRMLDQHLAVYDRLS